MTEIGRNTLYFQTNICKPRALFEPIKAKPF